jgi:hypothetical protein
VFARDDDSKPAVIHGSLFMYLLLLRVRIDGNANSKLVLEILIKPLKAWFGQSICDIKV